MQRKAACKGIPQTITNQGVPVVVVISVEEYQRLQTVRPSKFNDHLLTMPRDDGSFEPSDISLRNREAVTLGNSG
ncbi:MAG: type II toxin-antitoxin system prevent-host-death family antitoxin [Magnetococcales bacterium]|nr:type II toxin-antitoxin system prevent-host-death family antitoxin [Magnetococcales bacterium]